MKKNLLFVGIFLSFIACESDDEIPIKEFENSKSSNLKRDFSDSFDKTNKSNELNNRARVDSIPDMDIIHWHH
ncbi:hypothetical protein [Moheibacter sediminis]|uniref:Uncharacterized protein n=1 Tax=Moheibacter sediminis TaxID=1434700 RepID=A0A1W1ZCU6_9FLAO|nr:hypothetical protein [Moheibacter sediminis]SMC46092.1 hypothetical protein SAMN06296427_102384 [Moheibacter sediminis]